MTCRQTKDLGEGEGWKWGGWRCLRQIKNMKNCIIHSNKKKARIIHLIEGVNGSDTETSRTVTMCERADPGKQTGQSSLSSKKSQQEELAS